MRVTRDLGFSSLVVLVACLVFPVIGFLIRRKWRLDAARKEEIKRLMLLASEEAARAELEVAAGYAVASVARNHHQCAVCYCPTTTRCARCKAVRYCSGKCQIIHWRQGHKDECHAPASYQNNDDVSGPSQVVASQQHEGNGGKMESEDRENLKPLDMSSEEPGLSNCISSSDTSYGKDGSVEIQTAKDNDGATSASESSSTKFSGFSSSTSTSELSDDVSINDSPSSSDPETSDTCAFVNGPSNLLETASGINDKDQIKPLSPKFAGLVNSLHTSPNIGNAKHATSGCRNYTYPCVSTRPTGVSTVDMKGDLKSENLRGPSDFWERALNSIEAIDDVKNNSALSNNDKINDSMSSDSRSMLSFSFNFSANAVSSLCSEETKTKRCLSGCASESTLSESAHIDSLRVVKDSSINGYRSKHNGNSSNSSSPLANYREVKCATSASSCASLSSVVEGDPVQTKSSNVSRLLSSISGRSDHVANDAAVSSHVPDSRKVGCTSSLASNACISSGAGQHSVANTKIMRIDAIPARAAISSEVASHSENAKSGLKISALKVASQLKGCKLPTYPVGAGGEIAGRFTEKGLFPYETFVKLYNWNKVVLRPCGLINCGNSCYANAVLQCLAFTPPLTAYFLQGLHSKTCLKKEWCFACEFEKLILKSKEGTYPLSPSRILSQLHNIGSQLGHGREEDAHEFLRYSIETMQSTCLKNAGVKAPSSMEEETTLLGLTFGGYLRSKIKCTKCQGKSEREERMMDLTVEIDGQIGTLEEALRQFTRTEILDGENKYLCSRCKSYEKAKKKLTVLEAPNVLTIALKRFQSGKFGKLNKAIRFPEVLDLAPYMSRTSDKFPIYRLYAVVVHLDIMNAAFSGHYVCYVKNIQNKWFKVDDSTVTAVELDRVLAKGAYMLLYARCSPRPPRLIRNNMMLSSSDAKTNVTPSKNGDKDTSMKSRATSTLPNVVRVDRGGSFNFYSGQRWGFSEEDSSSDNSSLISNNSDEGSCTTDSTHDSMSADDLSDYVFGDPGQGWSSPWRSSSDTDTSTSPNSSSPLYPKNSPLAGPDTETSGIQGDHSYLAAHNIRMQDGQPCSKKGDSKNRRTVPFLHSDTDRHRTTLANATNSSRRETNHPEKSRNG